MIRMEKILHLSEWRKDESWYTGICISTGHKSEFNTWVWCKRNIKPTTLPAGIPGPEKTSLDIPENKLSHQRRNAAVERVSLSTCLRWCSWLGMLQEDYLKSGHQNKKNNHVLKNGHLMN